MTKDVVCVMSQGGTAHGYHTKQSNKRTNKKRESGFVSAAADSEPLSCYEGGEEMSMLEEIWTCGLSYRDRPVKSGSPLERKLCLYAKNQDKLKAMLNKEQTEQYQKTLDSFNDVVAVTEEEAFELGFTLAARLMMDVMRSAEISSIDDT